MYTLRAQELAYALFGETTGRWPRKVAVARWAEELVDTIGDDDPDVLIAAAWLLDTGDADAARECGLPVLDGARYLARRDWPRRICGLVAHHAGAGLVARVAGLQYELATFGEECSPLSDALTYADLTVGPDGGWVSVRQRLGDLLHHRGPGSAEARVHHLRQPHLLAIADRVELRQRRAQTSAVSTPLTTGRVPVGC